MSIRMDLAADELIESILRADLTAGEQSRFEGLVERLCESEGLGDRWLAASIMDHLADEADAEHLAWQEGRVWNLYGLGRVGETGFFYIGISQDVQARYQKHLKNARSVGSQTQTPVTQRIRAEMEPTGPGVRVETILPALTKETAKSLEALLVTEMVKNGADLENCDLRGECSPANRHSPGSAEFNTANQAAKRALHHEHQANDPAYRNRNLAKKALWELGQGARVTPRRIEVITLAGRVSDALLILQSQSRESEWPGGTPA